MPTMSPTTHSEVFDAAEHMPLGSTLVVNDFSWDEYELLLQDLEGRRNPRLSYDSGRLEVVMISPRHDAYDRLIDYFVQEFIEARGLIAQAYGQATWKHKGLSKGAEGDCCYYIQNARKVIGKDEIPLESNPPPDIVVEIGISSNSVKKLRIWAGLGVPEVWRFDGMAFHFYVLAEGKYAEVAASKCIPGLTGAPMLEALAVAEANGHTAARKAFRHLIRKAKK